MRKLALLVLVLASACTMKPRQLVVVTTRGWDAVDGTMRLYERDGNGWRRVGGDVPVVVGRTGMAWGRGEHSQGGAGPVKREGDGKAPAGIFRLGTAFGFDPSAALRVPYRPLLASTECVDDTASRSYNRIVERTAEADWKSSEKMRAIDQYRWGMVIEHNAGAVPGAGSCIFLHIWSGPSQGTAGCTAMAERDLDALLHWLDAKAAPRLVQLPEPEYARLRAAWSLP